MPRSQAPSRAPAGRGRGLAVQLDRRRRRHATRSYLYRIGFAAAGFVVLAAGLAMLVLPGPGLLVTAFGLGMLALEFHWAERLLLRAIRAGESGRDRLLRRSPLDAGDGTA